LKWVLMGMYPFVMLLASAIIDMMINGILIEGF
jgi:hypothetical protein